jgi:diaminohydroxyphosphoribosylaminopyrimidine deaminase/5-amino-6-(5-phosphoribosylamino)uracil reductase
MSDELDRRFLAAAIRLGASALGTTWPNPAVGAIVVKHGKVLGRGRTAPGGRPHAEPLALAQAGERVRGATLYVSLEPCSHHGKTPPCADAVIAAGVARVVAAMEDPNPNVAGEGLSRLRAAGIDVSAGPLADEARLAHAGHVWRITQARPYVTLKLAISADDAIGVAERGRAPVTGEIARRHAQALRSRYDAILVGRGTIEADDPLLTCRLPGLEKRSPVRVVLDSDARLAADRRVFTDGAAPTWVFSAVRQGSSNGHVRRFEAPRSASGLDVSSCLQRLKDEGIGRVLVEGGAKVARAFLETDLVDDVLLFRSPVLLGEGRRVAALAGLPMSFIEASDHFRRIDRRRFGADRMTRYERAD